MMLRNNKIITVIFVGLIQLILNGGAHAQDVPMTAAEDWQEAGAQPYEQQLERRTLRSSPPDNYRPDPNYIDPSYEAHEAHMQPLSDAGEITSTGDSMVSTPRTYPEVKTIRSRKHKTDEQSRRFSVGQSEARPSPDSLSHRTLHMKPTRSDGHSKGHSPTVGHLPHRHSASSGEHPSMSIKKSSNKAPATMPSKEGIHTKSNQIKHAPHKKDQEMKRPPSKYN